MNRLLYGLSVRVIRPKRVNTLTLLSFHGTRVEQFLSFFTTYTINVYVLHAYIINLYVLHAYIINVYVLHAT